MLRLRLLEPRARARLGPFPVKYDVFDELPITNLHSPTYPQKLHVHPKRKVLPYRDVKNQQEELP